MNWLTACQVTLLWEENPFSFDWRLGVTLGSVGLGGFGCVLASRWLNFELIAGCAAAVAVGLDILRADWTGLGSGALWGSLWLRGRGTVGAVWGLVEAQVTGGSCAVASAGSGTTGHELGAGITAVDVSYSASGWTLRGAGTARAGRGYRVVTAVEHPLTA